MNMLDKVFLMLNDGAKRVDFEHQDQNTGITYNVVAYWAGTIIRIDMKPIGGKQ